MKILGVVAGCGPFASNYFINRVLQLTPAKKEWEYFRIVADYNTFVPSRTRALLYGEKSPTSEIIRTIENLENMGANLVAIPCNSVHGWYDEVLRCIKLYWLNLIETTANTVKQRKIERVLVLGNYVTIKKRLYDKYLDNTIYLKNWEYERLYQLIEQLKLNENNDEIKKELYFLIKSYNTKVEGIIIACTELSMLFGLNESEWKGFQIINSTDEYAKQCVEICKSKLKIQLKENNEIAR
jgi:aspartate racemase